MDNTSTRRRALDRFASQARQVLGPNLLELRLFGSAARGDAEPGSDLDVLVVVQPDTERATLEDRVIDIAFDVNLESGLYISPRVVTRGILDDPVWRETPFLKNVARESVPLCRRPNLSLRLQVGTFVEACDDLLRRESTPST